MKKLFITLALLVVTPFALAMDFSKVDITVIPAAGQVYMLHGSGGNIAVLATEQGILLVDDQFKPLAEKIEAAMKGIVDKELKYIVNTHFHGDHTGSNAFFAEHAPIFAHENVRQRLVTNLTAKEDVSTETLPVVTYQNGVNIFLDKEEIALTHLPHGHTDGDTIVYFKKANVLHTGDLFFEVGFPYIDLDNGGSVMGYLANVRYMIEHTPDDVVIIPGHGKLTNKAGLIAFVEMLEYSIELVDSALKAGTNEAEILAQGVDVKYKKLSWRFITEERWLKTLIKDLR